MKTTEERLADLEAVTGAASGRVVCPYCGERNIATPAKHPCWAGTAPAPKPNELTVDDVLGVLRPCVNAWAVTLPSDAYVAAWGPKDKTDGFALFVDGLAPVAEGTLRDVLTEAKRRGMLG